MKVLKFGAVWCAGCLVMKPRWKELETENSWLETEYYDFDIDDLTIHEQYLVLTSKVSPYIALLDNLNFNPDKKKYHNIRCKSHTL